MHDVPDIIKFLLTDLNLLGEVDNFLGIELLLPGKFDLPLFLALLEILFQLVDDFELTLVFLLNIVNLGVVIYFQRNLVFVLDFGL